MKRFQSAITLLAVAVLVCTAAAAQTPDYAEGWIDLFDGETLFGWNTFGDGDWKVVDGALVCGGDVTGGDKGCGWIATTCQFTDFEFKASVRVASRKDVGFAFRAGLEGHPSENGTAVVPVKGLTNFGWVELNVVVQGDQIDAKIDGVKVKGVTLGRAKGYIGILYYRNKVEVKDIKLRPLNAKPIFNGKDLSGWNIIPGRKSKFSVVDSAINIKDGNGQIETEKLFKDFVLQMEIISNGTHLNSGVFYRGPVGIFWKGYESQVRNQWKNDDRTQPEDYGTGGNYGNQEARKVVSTDGEWLYKTIVCEGNHTSVWINGYLASDFYDTRPVLGDWNGKNGYVPGPGTIHLQGHDPTTDLSFRNIRVLEYAE
jgi:3-keto-disaccharide hydrolase